MYAHRYCPNMRLVRSLHLSVCGWNTMLSLRSMLSSLVVSFKRSEVNTVSLSVLMSLGGLCSWTRSLRNRVANRRASRYFEHAMPWYILVSWSITTSMVSCPSACGRSWRKSIMIDFNGWSGGSFNCSNLYGCYNSSSPLVILAAGNNFLLLMTTSIDLNSCRDS